jgi:N-acetylneuraminate lyase
MEIIMMKFKGIIPALISPLDENEKINVPVLKQLLNGLLEKNADGFYLCGATGEGLNLSFELHKEMAREAIKIIDKRVPAIVHVARLDFSEALALARHAEKIGADAISAIPPIFYTYDEEEICSYYKMLAESVSIPLVIYNNPNAKVTFNEKLLKRLFAIPNIKSIKWTNYDFATVTAVKSQIPEANFINGPDQMLLFGLTAGCEAGIGTTYNYLLPEVKKVYTAFSRGDLLEAQNNQSYVSRICAAISGVNIIMSTKFILSRLGYDVYYPIPPMRKLTSEEETALILRLRAVGMNIT